MTPLVAATLLLATAHLVSGSGYCDANTVTAQLSGTEFLRAPAPPATTIQYSDLISLGWKVPADRQPNAGSRGDFYSVMCNSQNDCTPQAPPYSNCTDEFDGTSCLSVGSGSPQPKSTEGVGEVRIAYTCVVGDTIKFWVLEYLFDKNGVTADFGSNSDWWVQFSGANNQKLTLGDNGACGTQAAVPLGIVCQRSFRILDGSDPVGVLFEATLPQAGLSGIQLKVHAEWDTAQTAATWDPEVCFKPCPAVSHDPHLVGAHGTHFDFNGLPGKSFCLLTDVDFHVNMQIVGYYDKRNFGQKVGEKGVLRSWIRELMILWRAGGAVHKFHLTARSGPSLEYGSGYLVGMALDGTTSGTTSPALEIGDSLDIPSLQFQFKRLSNDARYKAGVQEVYVLTIGDKLQATFQLRPAHPLLRNAQDAYVHLSMSLNKIETSSDVHGVLGQTYRDDRDARNIHFQKIFAELHHLEADGENGKGFLDGTTTDYVTSDIFTPDCKFNRFQDEVVTGDTTGIAI